MIKLIERYGLNDKKILEIGSGNGRFQDIVADYSGVDISEDLQKFYHKPFFVVEDGKPYPFQDESFDFVFTNAVFEHIPNIDPALSEMIIIAKRGGQSYLILPGSVGLGPRMVSSLLQLLALKKKCSIKGKINVT